MILLPIIERELRRATRHRWMVRARIVPALIGVLMGGWMLVAARQSWLTGPSVGRTLFQTLVWLAFGGCAVAGIFLTSLSLSREKQEGTLGLLFLTDLRGYDVVLGKLFAVSINPCQMLLGLFPILSICFVLGGVSLGEFWRAVGALASVLLLSQAAGLFVSALTANPGWSMAGTLGLVAALFGGLPSLDDVLFRLLPGPAPGYIVPGPVYAFLHWPDERCRLHPGDYWNSLWFTTALALTLLGLTSKILPRLSLANPRRAWRLPFTGRWLKKTPAGTPAGFALRRHLLRANPVLWAASRQRWKWFYLWVGICLSTGVWLACLNRFGYAGQGVGFFIFLALTPALHWFLKLAIAAEAASRFGGESRISELELLLVTPLSVEKICHGHARALQRQFMVPVVTVLLIDLLLIVLGDQFLRLNWAGDLTRFLLIWGMFVMLLVNLPALIWVGLHEGLTAGASVTALRVTLLVVLVYPFPFFLLSLAVSPVFFLFGLVLEPPAGWLVGAIVWWWFVGFGANFQSQRRAKQGLELRLRHLATRPASPEPGY